MNLRNVLRLVWTSSAVTTMMWEQLTSRHSLVIPISYAAAWLVLNVAYQKAYGQFGRTERKSGSDCGRSAPTKS